MATSAKSDRRREAREGRAVRPARIRLDRSYGGMP